MNMNKEIGTTSRGNDTYKQGRAQGIANNK